MISNKVKNIKSFIVMDVMARAGELEKAGEKVIHLEVGEPDFDTPSVVQKTAIEAIQSGKTHYTHAMGLFELREAICQHYSKEYNVSINPERVLVTSGTSPALLLIMMALLESGDSIIISNPHYACYPNFIYSVGGKPVEVRTYPEDGFQYRPESIKKALTRKTRGIVINSPSNPTGIVMTEDNLRDIASFEKQYIISDEIYHGLVYKGRAGSILEFTDRAFVINGFSKLYAMTGWRLGYLIFPEEFSGVMEKLHQNFMISANSFVQLAGIAALKTAGDEIQKMKTIYNERRMYMMERLKSLGFKIHVEPTGAFYFFADAREFCKDSYKMAFDILEKVKVGVTPGIDFGSGGEGFLRFSYANSLENIREGLDRIADYLKNRNSKSRNAIFSGK
ncbi:MAG: pyridoxal phosphate-dependent aminotransferase [Spirochaetes bacterium]|nr:pyridoxal phosphate-dependent aminotransferase [Spirochaetota bacterium]